MIAPVSERYFSGSPCVRCGERKRYVSNGSCVNCQSTRAKAIYHGTYPTAVCLRPGRRRDPSKVHHQGPPCRRCGETERYIRSDRCVPCLRRYHDNARQLAPI